MNVHEGTALIWNNNGVIENQNQLTHSYDEYWALKIWDTCAFDAYWLNPDYIIGEIDTPFINVLRNKHWWNLSQENLDALLSKYHPKTEVSHNKLKDFWYELIAITDVQDNSYPNYVDKRAFKDGDEKEFFYKSNEVFYRLIYAKALQSRFHKKTSSHVNVFSWKVSQLLSYLSPNK